MLFIFILNIYLYFIYIKCILYIIFYFVSATLFYIVKGRDRSKFGTPLRNHIIRTLLNGMEMHVNDDTMLRNGYLTLTQFQMPNDVVGIYNKYFFNEIIEIHYFSYLSMNVL